MIVTVERAKKDAARATLLEVGVVKDEGYAGTTTQWSFYLRTDREEVQVRHLLWQTGIQPAQVEQVD